MCCCRDNGGMSGFSVREYIALPHESERLKYMIYFNFSYGEGYKCRN